MKNNFPQKPPLPTLMSVADRELWLSSRNAPEGMHLIHDSELAKIMGWTLVGKAQLNQRNAEMAAVIAALGAYWKNEPTVVDAAEAAVFDAGKWEEAKGWLPERLEAIRTFICAIANGETPSTTETIDFANLAASVNAVSERLKVLSDKHRERRKP